MNSVPIHSIYTVSTLSVTDISGKIVINIVKKHIEDNDVSATEKHDTLTTEFYFLSAESTDENNILKMIRC
jgi:hypothetical protein